MTKDWEKIRAEYDKARACLREDGKDGWHRKQEEGWYHLWTAYYLATNTEPKEPLIYARILSMLNAEFRTTKSKFFLAPHPLLSRLN